MRDRRQLKVGLYLLDMHGRNRHDPRVAQELEERWGLKIVGSVQFNLHEPHANYRLIEQAVRNQLPAGEHFSYLNKMLTVIEFGWDERLTAMWSYDGNYVGVMELAAIEGSLDRLW